MANACEARRANIGRFGNIAPACVLIMPRKYNARDSTYGEARVIPRSYFTHHTQRISLAAVKYDALAIRKKMLSKKQKLAAHAAPTDGAWA